MSLTEKIVKHAEALRIAEKGLEAAIARYDKVKDLCGQAGYSVSIDGVNVMVACMDQRAYRAKMIRGREMIHLGALKALDAEVDQCREQIKNIRLQLADTADKLAKVVRGGA